MNKIHKPLAAPRRFRGICGNVPTFYASTPRFPSKSSWSGKPRTRLVLFVAHFFHPFHGLPVEVLLDGNVRHGRGRCGAVPMLFARREPDDVARPDFRDRFSPALRPTAASGHDKG